MTRAHRWLVGLGLVLGLPVLLWVAMMRLVPSDDELARRAALQLEAWLGVKVNVGALHWRLLPAPTLVMENIITVQPQPIVIQKLTAYPDLLALWQRRVKMDRVDLHGATVPQLSLGWALARPEHGREPTESSVGDIPLARLVFRDVTWISRHGVPVIYDGEVDFDPGWRPRHALLRRPGFTPVTDLTLTREGQDDRWAARINVGGGTAHGTVELQTRPNGRFHLEGALQPKDMEVESALAAFNRRSIVAGKASGNTVLSAHGDNVVELAQSLHTRTTFAMGSSKLLRFDLDKAIRSAGQEFAGQTALESVTGQLDTQNTPQGMVVDYTGIKAGSGALTASGKARVANQQVQAELSVDLVDGVVGVPLQINGPLENVRVSVSRGALAGAMVGTAILPGVGTAIGARIGATLGKILSPDPAGKPVPRSGTGSPGKQP
ncbi:AsmA-like C-terminal region-containing protein [Polaromonas sp. JS666]|uniref:AsmA-like C-terminal region-containing protein n=1 Tax=Polaromonas sp. (strain JS666 / ATCC BAA-500) TaxID=296591 RepID=UPI0000463C71|nr:AsmA-like C-terminal region-containing protein [Polaromonas sp. JS666]ABE42080.1 hypothetical protein Bpro_0115 [Polaromonas sp. JS666]